MKYNKQESLKKIAIKFGDNDFYNCFTVLLKSLHEVYKWTDYLPKEKDKLCFIINNLSPTMYVLGQNCWDYNGLQNESGSSIETSKEFVRTKEYLQITPDRLLVDDEVDKLIEEGDSVHFFNSEIFILDTTLFSNNVYAL